MSHPSPEGPGASSLPVPPGPAAAVTGSSVLAGGAWDAATKVLPQLYTLVASVIMARFLLPSDMGRQSFIAFAELSAVMIFSGGLPVALTRSISETLGRGRPGAVRSLVSWAWRIEGAAAALGVLTLVLVGLGKGELRPAWFLAGTACGLAVLHSVPSSVLYGTQNWRQATIAGTVTAFFGLIAVFIALALGAGIVGIFAIEAATSLVNLVWSGTLARRVVRTVAPIASPAPDLRRAMTRFGALSSIAVVLNYLVWRRSDFFFLDRYSSDEEIAFYSIGFGAVTALLAAAQAAGDVFTPAVANLMGASASARISSGFSRAMRLLLQAALLLTGAGLAVGPAVVVVAYGDAYRPATQVLLLLLAPVPVVALVALATALLIGMGRVWVTLAATGVGAVVNISLDILLVPAHGATGAAVASGVAQLTAGVAIVAGACRAAAPVRWHPATIVRGVVVATLAAVAARAGIAMLPGPPGILLGAVLGVVTYVLAATVVRPLLADDAEWLGVEVSGRLGPLIGGAIARWGRTGR